MNGNGEPSSCCIDKNPFILIIGPVARLLLWIYAMHCSNIFGYIGLMNIFAWVALHPTHWQCNYMAIEESVVSCVLPERSTTWIHFDACMWKAPNKFTRSMDGRCVCVCMRSRFTVFVVAVTVPSLPNTQTHTRFAFANTTRFGQCTLLSSPPSLSLSLFSFSFLPFSWFAYQTKPSFSFSPI